MTKNKTKKRVPNPAKKTIGINTDREFAAELEKRADKVVISTSKYCEQVLRMWVNSGKQLVITDKGW